MSFGSLFADDYLDRSAERFEASYTSLKAPPKHWSPSQLKTLSRCERAYWFDYRLDVPRTGSRATEIGSRVHAVLEAHLKGEIDLSDPNCAYVQDSLAGHEHSADVSTARIIEIARAGLKHLPAPKVPGDELHIEADFSGQLSVDGTPVRCFADIFNARDTERPEIDDHKTASSTRYLLDGDALSRDLQVVTYAAAVLELYAEAGLPVPESVKVRHIVYLTKSPGSPEPAYAVLTPEQILDVYTGTIEPLVRRSRVVLDAEHPRDVTPSWGACGDYGGCPHRERCEALRRLANPEPTDTGDDDMSIKDKLRAKLAARKAAQGGNPEPETKPEPKAPAASETLSLAERMKRHKSQGATGINPPDAGEPKAEPDPVEAKPAGAGKSVRRPRGWKNKLTALGWNENDFSSWSAAKVRETIESKLTPDMGPPKAKTAIEGGYEVVRIRELEVGDACLIAGKPVKVDDRIEVGAVCIVVVVDEHGNADKVEGDAPVKIERQPEPVLDREGTIEANVDGPDAVAVSIGNVEPGSRVQLAQSPDIELDVVDVRGDRVVVRGESGREDIAPAHTQVVVIAEPPAPKTIEQQVDETIEAVNEDVVIDEPAAEAIRQGRRFEREHIAPDGGYAPALSLIIAVDCLPMRPPAGYVVTTLADVLEPHMRAVEADKKMPRGGYDLLPYNEGRKLVCALLGEALVSDSPPLAAPTVLVVDRAHPCAGVCLELLLPHADLVLRG